MYLGKTNKGTTYGLLKLHNQWCRKRLSKFVVVVSLGLHWCKHCISAWVSDQDWVRGWAGSSIAPINLFRKSWSMGIGPTYWFWVRPIWRQQNRNPDPKPNMKGSQSTTMNSGPTQAEPERYPRTASNPCLGMRPKIIMKHSTSKIRRLEVTGGLLCSANF